MNSNCPTGDSKLSRLMHHLNNVGPNTNHLQSFLVNGTLSPRAGMYHPCIDSDDDEDEDANISDAIKNLIRKPFAQSLKAAPA